MAPDDEPVAPNPDMARYWDRAPAGWYTDPDHAGMLRFWDGKRWSKSVTPRVGSAIPPAVGPGRGRSGWRVVRGIRRRIGHR